MSHAIPADTDACRLPEGWTVATLDDGLAVDVQPGFACGANNREGEGIAHLRPMNVGEDGTIHLSDLKFVAKSEVDREQRVLHPGDVLFNNTNSPELVGKTACYDLPEPRGFSNHMTRVRCRREVLDPRYCSLALHQKWREGYFASVCNNHVSQASISRSVLLATPLLVPPLAEQKRIVAKVEELLGKVRGVRERLRRVSAILRRFRQAVLAAACSGRLTEDWRKSHPTQANHDVQELESIKAEVADRKASDRRRRDKGTPLVPPALPDDLPQEWLSATIGDLFAVSYGLSEPLKKTVPDDPLDIPIISMANVTEWGAMDLTVLRYFPIPKTKLPNLLLKPRDLLFNWRNSPKWIGKTCTFKRTDRAYVNASFLLRLRPSETGHYEEFVRLFLNYLRLRGYFEQASRAAVSQSNFNASEVSAIEIPFPPVEEQCEIVRRVAALSAIAEHVETRILATISRVEKIPQSILAKAFRGELVPTEAELARQEGRDFEPASVLLERIRAERAAADGSPGAKSARGSRAGKKAAGRRVKRS